MSKERKLRWEEHKCGCAEAYNDKGEPDIFICCHDHIHGDKE